MNLAMEEDDDLFLVIVDSENGENIPFPRPLMIKEEPIDYAECLEVEDIIETAQQHGQFVDFNYEPVLVKCEYLESEEDIDSMDRGRDSPIEEKYSVPNEETAEKENEIQRVRRAMLKSEDQQSFVEDLREQYPELRNNKQLLIDTLCEVMRNVRAPKLPDGYYVQDGVEFICTKCGGITESLPAAGRHYQEKHGPRYLICFACGVDFRSKTNLYKHEKRCPAPDAHYVLKARAICLGNKGRSRPYLYLTKNLAPRVAHAKFDCTLCSAKFFSKNSLMSHELMHKGERPFQCHSCPAAYTSNSALLRHLKKHSDEQYICAHCSRVFKIKAALVAHMDTHRPLRKHKCEKCERRFAQKSAMLLHVNRVHRNLPPPCACQICPKRYPRMSLLKTHMKKEHGFIIMTRKMFFKKLPMLPAAEVKQAAKLVFNDNVVKNKEKHLYDIENCEDDEHQFIVPNDLSAKDFEIYLKSLQEPGDTGTENKVFVIKDGVVTYLNSEMDDPDD